MTIASEITRLQWAKASAKASIINKGVNVPDNVKVDDYHTYIDMIDTGSWSYDGIKAKNRYFNSRTVTTIAWFYSWEENNTQYWLLLASADAAWSTYTYQYWGTGIKHPSWSDISYYNGLTWNYSDSYHEYASSGWYFIKNSTAGIVRWYFLEESRYTTNPIWTFEVVYNYLNNTCSCSAYSQWTSTDLASIVTVPDGYEVVSWSSWIKNITWEQVDSTSRFYITLK